MFFVLNALWFVAATVQRAIGDPLWLYLLIGIPVASIGVGIVARLFAATQTTVTPWSAIQELGVSGSTLSFRIVGASTAGRVRFEASSSEQLAPFAARTSSG